MKFYCSNLYQVHDKCDFLHQIYLIECFVNLKISNFIIYTISFNVIADLTK